MRDLRAWKLPALNPKPAVFNSSRSMTRNLGTCLGEIIRRGAAREAAADDQNVGFTGAFAGHGCIHRVHNIKRCSMAPIEESRTMSVLFHGQLRRHHHALHRRTARKIDLKAWRRFIDWQIEEEVPR